ncbi:hypothetical protein [Vibrio alfacsensis]|uniref:hypothetical protein n=1 Tax=Vibrio alfacsensis TaxID=1074311 RepID=UPI004068F438
MRKHAIVGFSEHVFANLYLDVLVNKCGVSANNLIFITLDATGKECDSDIVEKVSFDSLSWKELESFETLTFMSLNSLNSHYVDKIFKYSNVFCEKVYIYLTDDELDRWNISKKRNGIIYADKKLNISESCVNVIPNIRAFITLGKAFRDSLEDTLGRSDFRIIEGRDPFGTMPVRHIECLEKIYNLNTHHDSPEMSLLIGSKQGVFSVGQVIKIIEAFHREKLLDKFKFHVFTNKNNKKFRVLIDLYCLYLRKIKKARVDVGFPTATNSLTYTNIVMSCSYLLLQGRGGISTARTYLRLCRGSVAVLNETPNKRELVDGLGLDVISYHDFDDLVEKIKTQKVDIIQNAKKMESDLLKSYASLNELYR